jgi:RNA-directed DNA polymerase
LLKNIPIDTKILREFLKVGQVELENSEVHLMGRGLTQGGAISPTIANIVLDGLEKAVERVTRRPGTIRPSVIVIRYADDLIITAKYPSQLNKAKKVMELFLSERGLTLNAEKTKLLDLNQPFSTLEYLGFKFQICKSIRGPVLIVRPSSKRIQSVKSRLVQIFSRTNAKSIDLIQQSDPLITG